MRKTNRRRFRTDGDSTQLTFNVDTSQPFTIKSSSISLINLKASSTQTNIEWNNQRLSTNSQFLQSGENDKKEGGTQIQYQQPGNQQYEKQIKVKQNFNENTSGSSNQNHYSVNDDVIVQGERRTMKMKEQDKFGYREEELYLKYREEEYTQDQKIQYYQSVLRKKKECERMELQANLGIIPKISFINTLILRIMDKFTTKRNIQTVPEQQNPTLEKCLPTYQNKTQLRPKHKIKQKLPSIFIFQSPIKALNPHQTPIRRKMYRKYRIKYYVQTVRYDTGTKLQIIEGSFDAGQINPFLQKTMQFIINCVLKKRKGIIKHIVEYIEILQKLGDVIIRICCLVRPIIVPKFQCTFVTFESNLVKGLRIYSPNVQIAFKSCININEIDLNGQMSINNYEVKLSQRLNQKVQLIFRNLSLTTNLREILLDYHKILWITYLISTQILGLLPYDYQPNT